MVEAADALTIRVRPGIRATAGKWAALVETEATLAVVPNYNTGTNDKTRFPNVIDPQNVELNRAQLSYMGADGLIVTAGRQLLELGDERFVGSGSFRQNQQTFDAVRVQRVAKNGLVVDLSYAWSDRTVNGIKGRGARPQSIEGTNLFAIAGYAFPIGTATAFAYLVDQNDAAVQGHRLSSQTYGLRFAGTSTVSKTTKLTYVASWARQSDYSRNPNRYSADYWLGEATITHRAASIAMGYEILGASQGAALTSVQTPLGALFKFQGWADKFTTTPPDGVRDLYATIGGNWTNVRAFDQLRLVGTVHRLESDRFAQHYGDEVNLLASAKRGRTTTAIRFARYCADRYATKTSKFWLSLEWSY